MTSNEIKIPTAKVTLFGNFALPTHPKGLVIFVHGSGSSRLSPRNQFVAKALNQAGLATLLFDLLTPEEEPIDEITREFRFDIDLLSTRLVDVIDWVQSRSDLQNLPLGLFGASTGAAAALIGAALRPAQVKAVVSRGGRPDLANAHLPQVQAHCLLIVGSFDEEVIALNEAAKAQMHCPVTLKIVTGATHLFPEPGKLEEVTEIAKHYFLDHLA